jgi:hypothetical protein
MLALKLKKSIKMKNFDGDFLISIQLESKKLFDFLA